MEHFEDLEIFEEENLDDLDLSLADGDGDEEDDEIDWDAAFADQDESNDKMAEEAKAEIEREKAEKLAQVQARKEKREAERAAQKAASEANKEVAEEKRRQRNDTQVEITMVDDDNGEGINYTNKNGQQVKLLPYDFRRPIQLSKGFFRTLSIVSDTFAKLLTLSLSNYLRVPVNVVATGVRQVIFEEHTKSLPNPSCMNILDLQPIKIPGILDIDLALVFTMMDKLLGSRTLNNDLRREFTTIETRIARKIVGRMLGDLRESMLRILEVNPTLSSIEHNPDFTYIMNANDPCIILEFEVELAEFTGSMSVCMSLAGLDAELGIEGAAGYRDVRSEQERIDDENKLGVVLDSTSTQIIAEIAKIDIPFKEIEDLEVGSIINLRKHVEEPLTVRLNECAVFEGLMGRNKKKSAIKISKILWPNMEPLAGILKQRSQERAQ